uniref:ATP synthase mitochondrial F1 complex assembly factor 1-like n=1 Tax=Ciona intestinalis TaxID=7719 RepID=F7BEP5_CIOIN|nr:ATP synthase mitochondrial F1 complex assembly factor 1-like [Ciona intestinalis]|eukprot:XP_026690340.1 ATP synthase mitochondrial F1 complex assembly factor 1-like [Ciona intestinalis]
MSKGNCSKSFLQKLQGSNSVIDNMTHRYVRLFPILLGTSRPGVANRPFALNCTRSIASSQNDVVDLTENPFFQKYADKIQHLQKSNPEEYRKRLDQLKALKQSKREEGKVETENKTSQKSTEKKLPVTKKTKTLDDILKLEMVMKLKAEDIQKLWVDRYANKDAVCAVISSQSYCVIRTILEKYPVFVFPLPRKDGYEIFVGQFSNNDIYFTSLINYQQHKENAPSQLTLNHFTELESEKGIVLMSGPVFDDALSVTDAQLLAYQVQHFCTEHPKLIRGFNVSPQDFDINSVISSLDTGLLSKTSSLNK